MLLNVWSEINNNLIVFDVRGNLCYKVRPQKQSATWRFYFCDDLDENEF
jgi:hypothetical protein